jgi:PEP-CTERM/exosortase A-associated glycosyltransferase
MRILHVLDHSLPLQSGYAFRTASILREQHALGWETIHLTTPRQGDSLRDSEEAGGWQFQRTRPSPSWMASLPGGIYLDEMAATRRRIEELARVNSADIIHAHSPVLNALPALRVGSRLGIPVVYELRASWEDAAVDHGSTHEGSVRYKLSRALESYALRRADHVTTICEGLRGEIVARGVPEHKVTVIPNAVDTSLFQAGAPIDTSLRASLGLADKTVLGFAGSFYGYEGLDLLIEAMSVLAPSHPDMRVLLVGGGPEEQNLKAQTARFRVQDRVIFTGRVPHEVVQRYYDLIDVLLYPRHRVRLTELVTPLKPLEAMAQGRMIVASDVGGHKELIRDGETGFLFPADDASALARAVESVLARRSDWDRVRSNARRFVENERTWTRSVAGYADVYRRLRSGAKLAVLS